VGRRGHDLPWHGISPVKRLSFSLVAAPAAVALALTCAAAMAQGAHPPAAAGATGAAANLPDRPGKDLVILSCSGCHQPDIVIGQKRDAAAWRDLVDQMIARGANVEEAKYEEIITYLAQASDRATPG